MYAPNRLAAVDGPAFTCPCSALFSLCVGQIPRVRYLTQLLTAALRLATTLLIALLLIVLGHRTLALILFVALLGLLLLVFLIAHMSVFKQVKNSSLH